MKTLKDDKVDAMCTRKQALKTACLQMDVLDIYDTQLRVAANEFYR